MKEFSEIRGRITFAREAKSLFIETLSDFFSADIELCATPVSTFKREYGIDVTMRPRQNVYPLNNDAVLLFCNVKQDGEQFYLGIKIMADCIGESTKIFNVSASAISSCLCQCASCRFHNAISLVGDRLIVLLISKYLEGGYYSSSKLSHIIDKFVALRSTTFEGKYFSTGLLLTKSFHDYKALGNKGRSGHLLVLNNQMGYLSRIENRFWYLVDGFRTFYVTDLKKDIGCMFVSAGKEKDHFKNMVLYKTLKGGDALIRTEAGRYVSVITSDGIEFINQENRWKYRDYELLKKWIKSEIPLEDEVYNSLLYYVLYCSKSDISSLIWIPKNMDTFRECLKAKTINVLSSTLFNICDKTYSPLIKRIISSDGATVISPDGQIVAFGCMVDTAKAAPKGIKGTGETAASILSGNGVVVKVSQDGTIKVYLGGPQKEPIRF